MMKSYTDIEQSKKLAEILPLESADMRYQVHYDNKNNLKYIPRFISTIIPLRVDIPCWSLAALVGVLPYGYSSVLTKSFNGKDYYCEIDGKTFETLSDNPIDACYEMILKLHELKML